MSQDAFHPTEDVQTHPQPRGELLHILFDDEGQPIGLGSTKFVNLKGRVTKVHCPITYPDWLTVTDAIKDKIWESVLEKYDLEPRRKECVLQKANTSWKNWKYALRKVFDQYHIQPERIKNVPKHVKKEEWESFIEICLTDDEQLKRQKGMSSQKHMKMPHTSGRRGTARTKEELKKESPTGTVIKTQLFVALHTRTNGSCSSLESQPALDEIKRLISLDPYLGERDLDHDPVEMVCGVDGKGIVRGMGSRVSKTIIHAAAPFKDIARQEKRAHESSETNFRVIMERLDEESKERKILEEKLASYMRESPQMENSS